MPVVIVCPPVLFKKRGAHVELLEKAGFEVRFPNTDGKQLVESQVLVQLEGADAVLAGSEPYSRTVIERNPRLRIISRNGVGYDAVDLAAATERNIAVGYTPGSNHEAVAEHTLAMILALAKNIVPNHEAMVNGRFERKAMQPIRGTTLGIVGYGRIGRAVAPRARAFGMTVLAYDPLLSPGSAADDARIVSFDELITASDCITLHLPLGDDTRNLVRAETIAKMKPGVVLINTARGGLINEPDLAEALRAGRVRAAGIDVFATEPPVDCPLIGLPNVLLSPHIAGIDTTATQMMALMAAQTIVELYQGRWPAERIVNATSLPNWKW